jgi:hypothetical protein
MNKSNLFLTLCILFFLLLLLSAFANVRLLLSSQASSRDLHFSQTNSYLFISPLEAKADKKEKIRLSVFVLNDQGLGVPAKKVVLNHAPELLIDEVQNQTDNYGRAIFDLSTSFPGEYFLEATVDSARVGEGMKTIFK